MGAAALGSTVSIAIFVVALAAALFLKADPILLLFVTGILGAIVKL
jgi:hypothetical protein